MHILIVGETGVGKSTLIGKLLNKIESPVYGFLTEKTGADTDGLAKVYIHPANGAKTYPDTNIVGICSSKGAEARAEVFERVGAPLLTGIPAGAAVLMDELGFMESSAPLFCDRVLQILDGPYFVIAAVKPMNTPFLMQVRSHPKARVYNIDIDNRETLFERILSDLLSKQTGDGLKP